MQGVEGSIILEFDITPEGVPENFKIVESVPEGLFDAAVIDAASRWRYETSDSGFLGHREKQSFMLQK
ncbi:hypothetical protein NBRC116495_37370 [Aurantivibrio plasticivorans]